MGGTKAMAEAVAEVTAKGATTIVGGGDTATAARNLALAIRSPILPPAVVPA